MSQPELQQRIDELMDREAIRDCLARYCRGIDRQDEEALRSAYWPDATDRHGPYQGSATGFIDWALQHLASASERSVHHITNTQITLAGLQAAVETYFLALQRERDAAGTAKEVFLSGRYLDRFEKRDGQWRIAERTVVYDWLRPLGTAPASEAENFGTLRRPLGSLRDTDPLYALLARVQA